MQKRKPNKTLVIALGVALFFGAIGTTATMIDNKHKFKEYVEGGVGVNTMQIFNIKVSSNITGIVRTIDAEVIHLTYTDGKNKNINNIPAVKEAIGKARSKIQVALKEIDDVPVNKNQINKKNEYIVALGKLDDSLVQLGIAIDGKKDISTIRKTITDGTVKLKAVHGIQEDVR